MDHPLAPDQMGALILAAGKGTRMHTDTPKVLQQILAEPMLRYVYDAVAPVCGEAVWTVVGHRADMVEKAFPSRAGSFILQAQQLGTGHALQVAWEELSGKGFPFLLVIYGDTPLLPEEKLQAFAAACLHEGSDIAFMTLTLDDPGAFGRVVRKNGRVTAIVEAKDYDVALHGEEPHEINAGIYCLRMDAVAPLLPRLSNANKNGEFYITDLIGLGVEEGLRVAGLDQGDTPALLGINTPLELVRSEERIRAQIVEHFQRNGVIIRAAQSVRIGPDVEIAPGVSLTGPLELYGKVRIEQGVNIASHCVIQTATIARGTVIQPFTHILDAVIGEGCSVGPYSRLRPAAVLEQNAHVGNFVEIKKSRLKQGAKASHLSYIGDAEVGAKANIGAGTITCNYDGVNKHATVIGDGAFIGSNTSLVAPVHVGSNATVGAGSVITKDIPDNHLGVTRAKQMTIVYPRKTAQK